MKRIWGLLLIVQLLSLAQLNAQVGGNKPLRQKSYICRNTSKLSIGVIAGGSYSDMIYSDVTKAKPLGLFGPVGGVAMEWNGNSHFSLGFNALYAVRGTRKSFDTEFQTSFTETNTAHIHYRLTMNCLDFRIPISYYFGYESNTRFYAFVAPNFSLLLNGNMAWHRTYLKENPFYGSTDYEMDLTKANARPYEISALVGMGIRQHLQVNRLQMYLKVDFAFNFGLMNDFSDAEMNLEPVFSGWGDIEHETLGTRRMQALELKVSLIIPFKKHLKDACTKLGKIN